MQSLNLIEVTLKVFLNKRKKAKRMAESGGEKQTLRECWKRPEGREGKQRESRVV